MILFARVLQSVVEECDRATCDMFLIEFAQRKGGIPIKFYLYRQVIQKENFLEDKFEMICVEAPTAQEAVRRYWPCSGATGKEFPGFRTNRWIPTNPWVGLMSARNKEKKSDEEPWVEIDSLILKSIRDARLSVLIERRARRMYVRGLI